MKKIYSIALAASVAFGASAAQELSQALDAHSVPAKQKVATELTQLLDQPAIKVLDETADADLSIQNLEGVYTWEFYNYLQNGGWENDEIEISINDATKGEVTISLAGWEVIGTYDEATATLTIASNQDLGYNEYNDIQVYLYHRVWNSNGEGATFVDDPFVLTFDGTNILFPTIEYTGEPMEGLQPGEQMLADMIGIGNSSKGWFLMAGENEVYKKVPYADRMPEGEWTSVGTGMFYDSWIGIIAFGEVYDQDGYGWEVEVEQNSINPALFRMVNPYTTSACPFYEDNANTEEDGYIVFNVEDPECVLAYPYIYSGMNLPQGEILNFNMEGAYCIVGGATPELIKANMAQLKLSALSTYKKGTITFENCRCATKDRPEAAFIWKDQNGLQISGPGFLDVELPTSGITNLESDDENAPVEYFNLQGVRVANPSNNLFIVRQGNKVTKQVIK